MVTSEKVGERGDATAVGARPADAGDKLPDGSVRLSKASFSLQGLGICSNGLGPNAKAATTGLLRWPSGRETSPWHGFAAAGSVCRADRPRWTELS